MTTMYTSIAMSGTVATLLNRDAMLNATVAAGSTTLDIGDAYMDRGTNTTVVFPAGCTLLIGSEAVTVSGSPPSGSTITITPALASGYPIYTPVLRTDYFDVSTAFSTMTAPGAIRVGMEDVSYSAVTVASDRYRCVISSRGDNAYPHTEWAPVVDAAYSMNNPEPGSPIATIGVIEDVDFHHGAMDQNTLDLRAYEKLMAATQPEYGRIEMVGMDIWQDAYYGHKKTIPYSIASPTSIATVQFTVNATSGTDSATAVYIANGSIQNTWWDIRFITSASVSIKHHLETFSTISATVWLTITGTADTGTVEMYYGNRIAIDSEVATPATGHVAASLGSWSAVQSGTFFFGDRGYAQVREGDPVNVVETDLASREYRMQGMIYDQRMGTLTMEIGKPEEFGVSDLVKPFRTLDIVSSQNL